MHSLFILLVVLPTIVSFIIWARCGAAFCSNFWPERKWIPAAVALCIIFVSLGGLYVFDAYMTLFMHCVALSVMGFAGGIAVRMRQLETCS